MIFGNSISTYHGGWIPDQYDCFYEVEDASRFFGLSDVSDCWWYMVYDQLRKSHRKIVSVINVSYSGSRVTGNKFPSGQSYRRIKDIEKQQKKKSPESQPGFIILCLGYNDFGTQVVPRNTNPLHGNNFEDAYLSTLTQLRDMYPSAVILCTTLLTTTVSGKPDWRWPESERAFLGQYNDAIRYSAEKVRRCRVVDLAKWTPDPFETLDGIHPNHTGHKQIATAFISCLEHMDLV